jgi:hypothetical protein
MSRTLPLCYDSRTIIEISILIISWVEVDISWHISSLPEEDL